jgi:hypothetical protein
MWSVQALSKFNIPVAFPEYEAATIHAAVNLGRTSPAEIPEISLTGPAPISQLRIQGAENAMDQARVEQILIATAERFAMLETTGTSGVRGTIRCYAESPQGGFAVGARFCAGDIVVDFFAGREPTPRFLAVVEHICAELRRVFVERIMVVKI